jgi:hypothetical protein
MTPRYARDYGIASRDVGPAAAISLAVLRGRDRVAVEVLCCPFHGRWETMHGTYTLAVVTMARIVALVAVVRQRARRCRGWAADPTILLI